MLTEKEKQAVERWFSNCADGNFTIEWNEDSAYFFIEDKDSYCGGGLTIPYDDLRRLIY